ncbi:hypothetical protein PCANB_002485 [Pneumocystis canis]|nr:hypothetical protein PCK1_002514 [Pneumocystis canis]KAG5438765.1 hypothetical protein PCANB_002485 [Pneumocystis canis]
MTLKYGEKRTDKRRISEELGIETINEISNDLLNEKLKETREMKENRTFNKDYIGREGERIPLWVLNTESIIGDSLKDEPRYVFVASEEVTTDSSVFSCTYAMEGFVTPSRERIKEVEKNTKILTQSAPAKSEQSSFKKFDIYYDKETYIQIPGMEMNTELFSFEMNKENISPEKSKWVSHGKKSRL